VFPDPGVLDLRRGSGDGVAFGGGGVHFCLGSVLARAQLRALLREVLTRMPGLTLGEPVFGFSEFTHLVESLPVVHDRHRTGA
jgi:cytochrome P450